MGYRRHYRRRSSKISLFEVLAWLFVLPFLCVYFLIKFIVLVIRKIISRKKSKQNIERIERFDTEDEYYVDDSEELENTTQVRYQ